MKHRLNILLLTFMVMCTATSLPLAAQEAGGRQRATETIVQDILALMPIQQKADFEREMEDVAKAAPATVEQLCQMLQPAEKASNAKVEYAISGVVNYVGEHPEYKDQVLRALKLCAPRAADATARQFINAQARLLDPDADPVEYTQYPGAAPYTQLWAELQTGGKVAEKATLRAVKSSDRALRMEALKYATDHQMANKALTNQVVKLYKKGNEATKVDIINWLGDNKVSPLPALAKGDMDSRAIMSARIEALGKIGSQEACSTLLNLLGSPYCAEALTALRSLDDNISGRVNEALKTASGTKQTALLQLAAARRIRACGPQVIALALNNEEALKALSGVVIAQDAPAVANLLDKATDAQVPYLQKAVAACYQRMDAAAQFAAISDLMNRSSQPERYYTILAATATDESVATLSQVLQNDPAKAKAALEALKQSNNYQAAKPLWSASSQGDDAALRRYAWLVNRYEQDTDRKASCLAMAMEKAQTAESKKLILGYIGSTPTLPAFTTASQYLDDKEAAYAAAYACKNIASKAAADIDYNQLQTVLTKASERIKAGGSADDGYAVDEIKKIMTEAQPVPECRLTDEEARQGFELLFDGKSLDKWQGNKVGYVPLNGTIYVTANYGNEGNLYTVDEYRDFVFRFEFCFVRPGVNNGVGIRTPQHVDAAYDAMCECQILDHDDPIYAGLRDYQVHGSVYGIIPAKRIKHKPLGEWSTEEIRVKGNHITVTVNGEVIVDGDVKEACKGHNVAPDGSDVNPYTVDHHNHPGLFNKKGHISFCGHGPGIKFRNIRVLRTN